MTIGILALQGAFIEHAQMLDTLGADHFEIRQFKDLERPFDGLILPGGESTVMGKLLRESGMYDTIKERIQNGLPVFGTCAGLILLAGNIDGETSHLGTMDIVVKRNAYGRQLGSFYTEDDFKGIGNVPMTFIRAPYIAKAKGNVDILSKVNDRIVAARQGNQLVTAFHPELSEDTRVHEYFLEIVSNARVTY